MDDISFIKIPIDLTKLMGKKDLPKCNIYDSIAQNIYVILTSKFGENRFNPKYGCEIWETDFEFISNETRWKTNIINSVTSSLSTNEPRLYDIKVDVEVKQEEVDDAYKNARQVKRSFTVNIAAKLTETKVPFTMSPKLYLSPFSIE